MQGFGSAGKGLGALVAVTGELHSRRLFEIQIAVGPAIEGKLQHVFGEGDDAAVCRWPLRESATKLAKVGSR